jgi:hypothetical protein
MSSRPLPGASYHTLETILHSFANVDLEAVGSLETLESSSEKRPRPSDESTPLLENRVRIRYGLPMLLGLIVFFCLAFTASAFVGYTAGRWLMPDVPDRHVSIADHLSSAFEEQSHFPWLNEYYNGLVTMDKHLNCLRGDECQELNMREFFFRTFPLLDSSLNRTDVAKSAVVLHWQGTDSTLKPVLITNSDAVLDIKAPHAQDLSCRDDKVEHQAESADIQSGVGMMFALDALLRSDHRPSRSLVFSLMLGEASDAPKVSEHLRATYGELGLGMEFEPPAPTCQNDGVKASRLFRKFIGKTPGAIVTLHPTSSVSRHAQAKPFDADEPRLFRYVFSSTINQATLTRLRVKATRVWTRLILGADSI